jgi:hypothetical protein
MHTLEEPRREDLGALVGEHKQGDTQLWLFRKGLFVEQKRHKFAGGFDDIRGVYVENKGGTVKLRLPGRLWVRLPGGEAADATVRGLLRMVMQALLRRGVTEYDRGQAVDFGAVRLSKDSIAVRRLVGWKRLPLSKLSGFAVRNGWLFLDTGDARPEPFAEVRVGRIANLEVLLALLRKARGDADLVQPANALRHRSRGKTWLSRPTHALSRRPRTFAKALARWSVYAAAIAAGGYLGTRYDLAAMATSWLETLRPYYHWLTPF